MKNSSRFPYILALGCIAFMVVAGIQYEQNQPRGVYSLTVKVADYTLQGPPTITAALIDQVLADAHSPAAESGQTLYSLGVQYGIDPVYALAFFHLSHYGTSGEAAITHSLGTMPCIPTRPCIDAKHGGYAVMQSWADGFDHWYSLMLSQYIKQWQRLTVEQIIPKYESNSSTAQADISAVEQDVVQWRAEQGGQP